MEMAGQRWKEAETRDSLVHVVVIRRHSGPWESYIDGGVYCRAPFSGAPDKLQASSPIGPRSFLMAASDVLPHFAYAPLTFWWIAVRSEPQVMIAARKISISDLSIP